MVANGTMMVQSGTKENIKCSEAVWQPQISANAIQRGLQNNLTSKADLSARQSWHKNVVVSQENRKTGIFASLWKKKRGQGDPPIGQTQNQQPIRTTGNHNSQQQHAWMTLRVPPSNRLMPESADHVNQSRLGPQQQPLIARHSHTLRPPSNHNASSTYHYTVMPNPDDILPKEAWTDFSGTNDWPRFSGLETQGLDDRPPESQTASPTAPKAYNNNRLYVNCQKEIPATQLENIDGQQDRENSNSAAPAQTANGLQGHLIEVYNSEAAFRDTNENFSEDPPLPSASSALQQIENNLMSPTTSTTVNHEKFKNSQKTCEILESQKVSEVMEVSEKRPQPLRPPRPPPRNCISQHQRLDPGTKAQQSKGNSLQEPLNETVLQNELQNGLQMELQKRLQKGSTPDNELGHHYLEDSSSSSSRSSFEIRGQREATNGGHVNDSRHRKGRFASGLSDSENELEKSAEDVDSSALFTYPDSNYQPEDWQQSPLLK